MSTLLGAASSIAIIAHDGQVDKAGKPYYLHPRRVAAMMVSEEDKAVAWLHDVVEDTSVTLEQLCLVFPPDITDAVDAISQRKGESFPDYYARVKANARALRVKLGDNADNASEERLAHLAPAEADRLRRKYARTREMLLEGAQ